jgi:CheY-like chemotaxis protein
MQRIQLIHWKEGEAAEKAERLKAFGYEVSHKMDSPPRFLRRLGENPPAAVVVDLSRLPSHGREIALSIRMRKSTRHTPLVFVGGAREKVARVKALLPDAVYTSWEQIAEALQGAIAAPPTEPIVPDSQFQAYTGRSLVQKLGIKPDEAVGLVGAPGDFDQTLGALPQGVTLVDGTRDQSDPIIWFVRSQAELKEEIAQMAARTGDGRLWIAWPKKASKMATDLTQQDVRETGLATGLVDYKICAIDKTWSGLLFTRRKTKG